MEKELYKILQEIKIGINMLENTDINKYINELTELQEKQENLYYLYQEAYDKYKSKFRALSILTFGIYYKKNKYDYDLRCELYEGAMELVENSYFGILSDKVYYKLKELTLKEKQKFFVKNFNQIDNFFNCIKDLSKEEKEKYLTYKIN